MRAFKISVFVSVLFVFGFINGQTLDSSLRKAFENTMKKRHFNQWIIVNQTGITEENDSLMLSEGISGDTFYTEIEGESKMLSTKKLVVMVDDFNRMIYTIPKSVKNRKKYTVQLPDSLALMLAVESKDSLNIQASAINVYEVFDNGELWKIAIDPQTHLIQWIETLKENVVEDYSSSTYKEKEEQRTIRMILKTHTHDVSKIKEQLNPMRFVQPASGGYKTSNAYSKYELIDLFN